MAYSVFIKKYQKYQQQKTELRLIFNMQMKKKLYWNMKSYRKQLVDHLKKGYIQFYNFISLKFSI